MPTLIDGYNLLYALGVLTARSGKHALEGARRSLLIQVQGGHGPGTGDVTVVFDARSAPPGSLTETEVSGIHVKFAHGQTADDLIEDLIRDDPSPRYLIVVSDDHRIQQSARRRGCQVMKCVDYYESLVNRAAPPRPAAAEPPAKPERCSPEETQHWLDAFADVEDDPQMRDGF